MKEKKLLKEKQTTRKDRRKNPKSYTSKNNQKRNEERYLR